MKKYIFLGILLMHQYSAWSQSTDGTLKSEEIDIIKPYQPILADAVKLNFTPESFANTSVKPELTFVTIPKIPEIHITTPQLKPIAISKEITNTYHPILFTKLGIGNYNALYANVVYNSIVNPKTSYGIDFLHHSNNAFKNNFQAIQHNNFQIFVNHFSKKIIYRMGGNVDFNKLYVPFSTYYTNKQAPFNYLKIQPEIAFNTTNEAFKNGSNSTTITPYYFNMKNKSSLIQANEWGLLFKNNILYNLNKSSIIGALVDINYNQYKFSRDNNSVDSAKILNTTYYGDTMAKHSQQNFLLQIKPSYTILFNNWKLQMGFNTAFSNNVFYWMPQISVYKNIIPSYLSFYANWESNVVKNSYQKIANEVPYIGLVNLKNNPEQNIHIGISGNSNNKFYYSIKGGVILNKHQYFITNPDTISNTILGVQYYDEAATTAHVQTNLGFKLIQNLEINVVADYFNYLVTKQFYAYSKPNFTGSLNATYSLKNKIIIKAGLHGASDYKTLFGHKTLTRKGFVDPYINLEYVYSKNLRLFLNANNFIDNKYQQLYGYNNYRLQLLGGLIFNF